jgi:hypothetical protein
MTAIATQILNTGTSCWETVDVTDVDVTDVAYLLSEAGALEVAIESGALPGSSMRCCEIGQDADVVSEGRAATMS